jgi:DNA (cytosine-5)-methyltransferase 1
VAANVAGGADQVNYYNENNPEAAAWLRELIAGNHIAPGIVDERSITDVTPGDLAGYVQCHFFAGIGGWSLALRLAGWPDGRSVWTGSCPCQPYSVGSVAHGGAKGPSDSRDLWPDFYRLIWKRNPPIVFGEQVASAIPWGWLDRAAMDLESKAFSVGSAVLRADAKGFPHERKRLYWVAVAGGAGWARHQSLERLSEPAPETLAIYGDPLAGARRALAGDYSHLLPCDGLSVAMERDALKGYGNAIVPHLAAEFIKASQEAILETERR